MFHGFVNLVIWLWISFGNTLRVVCTKPALACTKGREPLAHGPDMALFKTALGSLDSRQIYADISSRQCKTVIPPEGLSKLTAGFVFRCYIARQSTDQGSLKSDNFVDPSDSNIQFCGSHVNTF